MDLFGIKKRRARREANARQRAEALDNAIRLASERPAPTEARRYRPPTRRPERYNDPIDPTYGPYATGGVYPHSSRGMDVDYGNASWAQPSAPETHRSGHDSLGAAGSGLDLGGGHHTSHDYGSTNYGSDSSSGGSDSGSSYSGE